MTMFGLYYITDLKFSKGANENAIMLEYMKENAILLFKVFFSKNIKLKKYNKFINLKVMNDKIFFTILN